MQDTSTHCLVVESGTGSLGADEGAGRVRDDDKHEGVRVATGLRGEPTLTEREV